MLDSVTVMVNHIINRQGKISLLSLCEIEYCLLYWG